MKKIFLHNYLFRLILAVASGILSYLLILMSNNNLAQLEEYVFSSELYLCCGISLILFELLRLVLLRAENDKAFVFSQKQALRSCSISVVLSVLLITAIIYIYYTKVVGYSPSSRELLQFNIVFSFLSLLYTFVYLSNLYLFAKSTSKLKEELVLQEQIEQDFEDFRRGINSDLLFESLEMVLGKVDVDVEEAEEIIDRLAVIYRYLLTIKEKQVVDFEEESVILDELVLLLNKLPYRKVQLEINMGIKAKLIPGALLFLIQEIVRTSIVSSTLTLDIKLSEEPDVIKLAYKSIDKLNTDSYVSAITALRHSYSILTEQRIVEIVESGIKSIRIPILRTKQSAI